MHTFYPSAGNSPPTPNPRAAYHTDNAPNNAALYLALTMQGYTVSPVGEYRRHIHPPENPRPQNFLPTEQE